MNRHINAVTIIVYDVSDRSSARNISQGGDKFFREFSDMANGRKGGEVSSVGFFLPMMFPH